VLLSSVPLGLCGKRILHGTRQLHGKC
jgi:hypothetical protein